MEDLIIEEKVGSDYIIHSKIGSGGEANIFLVTKINEVKEYVAKVPKREDDCLSNEINILKELKQYNNPYIVKIIDSGEGDIIRKERKIRKRKYAILEQASNGCLFDYIFSKESGLGELKSKILFLKILDGIKCCHDHNICHRDIKLENILLDKDFIPKINDFGFACKTTTKLTNKCGTDGYLPPEINGTKKYDGFKADIFCLASSLMVLTTGIPGFEYPVKTDKYFHKIMKREYNTYWALFDPQAQRMGITLSKQFKDLYFKMICYKPEKRPNINEILADPWFQEIEDMKKNNKEKLDELEQEIREIFINLTEKVKNNSKRQLEKKNIESMNAPYNTRGIQNDKVKDVFNKTIKPKLIHTPMNMNHCITIKGNLNSVNFMNQLCYMIDDKFGTCFIQPSKEKLKFNVIFEEEKEEEEEIKEEKEEVKEEVKEENEVEVENKEEEEEKKEEEEEIAMNELVIQIKLYKSADGHILRLIPKKGNRRDFLKKFVAISKLAEIIIN